MPLDLIFETPQETVRRAGPLLFQLWEQHGRYALPDVYLETRPGGQATAELHEAVITDIQPRFRDTGQLAGSMRAAWRGVSGAPTWIAARHEVISGATVSAARLAPAFARPDGLSVSVEITWRFSFNEPDRAPMGKQVTVTLEFMAPGLEIPPPPAEPYNDPEAARLGVPAALRDVEGRRDFSGFAAIDFGTSSSTVTVYDARQHLDMVIDPAQATRLRLGLADLLRDGPFDSGAAEMWQRLLEQVPEEVAAYNQDLAGMDAAALQSRLRAPSVLVDGRDLLLDAVCAAVENVLVRSDGALRDWLSPRLLRVYDAAFNVPPLTEMFLRQVVFDRMTGSREISSTVTVQDDNPITIVLGRGEEASDPKKTIRALKTKLQKPQRFQGRTGRDGREASTDDLIAHVFLALTKEAERFAHDKKSDDPEIVRSLVVTYPTTTPASTREHLRNLVRHTLRLDTVVTDFDEGVAAGLFFLLRDFGSNRREFGTEALRARSRRVADDPPAWQQNMLVLDMGAGTTDIVLISLTLTDMTRPFDGYPPLVQGRYYVIKPEVRNSTGHPQLGGDYLTLRVFYWLKATIADALLYGPDRDKERADLRRQMLPSGAGPGEIRPRLAAAVLDDSGDEEPVPDVVKETLRALLPTDWKDRPEVRPQAFEQLWSKAEEVKIALGATGAAPFTISRDDLAAILLTGDQTKALIDLLPANGITLASADLLKLARPVLTQAVQLASWLVLNTLAKDESLDRVMLAGRSSIMPLMRQVVMEELAAAGETSGGGLNWNPLGVTVEAEYAKQAASIGACWAQSVRNRAVGLDDAKDDLIRGRTQIMIDVDNLTHTLPCAFHLQRQGRDGGELLKAGIRLTEIDEAGTIGVRSEWRGLTPDFQINRPLKQGMAIQWGVYHYDRQAAREGFLPSDIWGVSADIQDSGKVKAQLEVTQTLEPYLQLCQGAPQYVMPEKPVLRLARHFPEAWHEAGNRLTEIPAAIWVSGQGTKQHPNEEMELFPAWQPEPEEDITACFGVFFRDSHDAHLDPRPGRISGPLPRPKENGEYRFFLRWPDGRTEYLHAERMRTQRGPTSRFVATLDVRGHLFVHRGNPTYWQASSLERVQDYPGTVFRVPMEPGVSDIRESWDPFNGSH